MCAGLGRWRLGFGRQLLGVGCWALGVGRWVLGAGCWVLGVGRWALGAGRWVLGAGRGEPCVRPSQFRGRHMGLPLQRSFEEWSETGSVQSQNQSTDKARVETVGLQIAEFIVPDRQTPVGECPGARQLTLQSGHRFLV